MKIEDNGGEDKDRTAGQEQRSAAPETPPPSEAGKSIVLCPNCSRTLKVESGCIGKIRCPACKHIFTRTGNDAGRPARKNPPPHFEVPHKGTGGGSAAGNVPPSQPSARNQKNDPNNSSDCLFAFIGLGVIGLLLWLLWLFATGMPRLAFWLIVPLFWIIYMASGGLKRKFLTILLLVGTVVWGWLALG